MVQSLGFRLSILPDAIRYSMWSGAGDSPLACDAMRAACNPSFLPRLIGAVMRSIAVSKPSRRALHLLREMHGL